MSLSIFHFVFNGLAINLNIYYVGTNRTLFAVTYGVSKRTLMSSYFGIVSPYIFFGTNIILFDISRSARQISITIIQYELRLYHFTLRVI